MILGELIVGAAIGWSLWAVTRQIFGGYVFQRRNYRDCALPTGVGTLLPLTVAGVVAVAVLSGLRRGVILNWGVLSILGPAVVALAGGFALVGLLDDLAGAGESGGFRGHLGALRHGRLTTGGLKLVASPVIAIAVLGWSRLEAGNWNLVRDAAVICLAANLANLFDRAPGRVIKAGLAAFAVLWSLAPSRVTLAPVAVVIGGSAGLLRADLNEQMMLGDAGSNVIGAALGFGVVTATSAATRWWVLGILVGANLLSELVSFSKVIDEVGPLRWLDRLGARHRHG